MGLLDLLSSLLRATLFLSTCPLSHRY
uniref:Uncharacterized protein n=1 Tax=Anguilla anguilla TaxID=7936 RepID=A0A0E9T9L8_ANGAN